eukprot:m.84544 g.84544  ORF g.84544 m.84544 type:complete len:450 (+) comp12972_c0_seq1:427-1776(+)
MSVPRPRPASELLDWRVPDVVVWVENLSAEMHQYTPATVMKKLDGTRLADMDAVELAFTLGVTNEDHKLILQKGLSALRTEKINMVIAAGPPPKPKRSIQLDKDRQEDLVIEKAGESKEGSAKMRETIAEAEGRLEVLSEMKTGLLAQIAKGKKDKAKVKKNELKNRIASVETSIEESTKQIADLKVELHEMHAAWHFGNTLTAFAEETGMMQVPLVTSCIKALEAYGMDEEGLFRVPGDTAAVEDIQRKFEGGEDPLENWDKVRATREGVDPSTVASCLKLFLRKLKEPVLMSSMYDEFMASIKLPDDERTVKVKELLQKLPKPHIALLQELIPFLLRVSQHSEENKMTIRNLAVVFGPTLLRVEDTGDASLLMGDSSKVNSVVEFMIKESDAIFSSAGNTTVPAPTTSRPISGVPKGCDIQSSLAKAAANTVAKKQQTEQVTDEVWL